MKNCFFFKNLAAVLLVVVSGFGSSNLLADEVRFFLSQSNGGSSTIYEVTISGTNADLSEVVTVGYPTHIAFNESTKQMFFVNSENADYQSYDVSSNTLGSVYDVTAASGSYVAAGFEDGINLTIGNAANGKLYSIPADYLTPGLTEIVSAPVNGGDVVYLGGEVYLATRSGNRILKKNGGSFELVTTIPSNVTGMAATADGKLLVSFFGSTTFRIYNTDGTLDAVLDARLGGEPYTQMNGDLTSGSFEVPCFATELIEYNPTTLNDFLTPVSALRTIGTNALGMPQNSDATVPETDVNFASLGFGGDMTLGFSSPIKNGDGNDLKVFETTYAPSTQNCVRYPERIKAYASQDLCHWVYLGEGCQDTEFDLGPLAWAQYIKLVDVTPAAGGIFSSELGDGYDVDGVICLNGYEEDPQPSELVFGSATEAWLTQGTRKNGSPVVASRSNKDKALGMPEGTDVINFVSLGFGGELILKFDYVIFDQAGNDIQIVETSYGSPSCNQYPEKMSVEGSLDGITYVPLTVDDICLDGYVDIAGNGPIQYIKIMDRSMASQFGGSADGYDVDGVVVLTTCNGEGVDLERIADDNSTPDEVTGSVAYPNPFSSDLTVEISTGADDNTALIEVSNYLGQSIYSERINVAASAQVLHQVSARNLERGIYFITVTTNSNKEVIKVVKN